MKKNEIVLYKDSTSTVRAFEPNSDNQVMIVWFTGGKQTEIAYYDLGFCEEIHKAWGRK
jgi:hypothetical protein